jgi:hypothetical protein
MSSFRRPFTVRRRAIGSYDQATDIGFFKTEAEDETFVIKASKQPTSGSDMKLLPENRREEEIFKLYTDTELFGAEKGSGGNADIVEISGKDYEVIKVFPWDNGVINHYKVFVAKRTTNDPEPEQEEEA